MKINGNIAMEDWVFNEGIKTVKSTNDIYLEGGHFYNLVVEYFNSKVNLKFFIILSNI